MNGTVVSEEPIDGGGWSESKGWLDLVGAAGNSDDLASMVRQSNLVDTFGNSTRSLTDLAGVANKVFDFLKGYRYETTLLDDAPVFLPLVEVWSASGGKIRVVHKRSKNASADLTFAWGVKFGSSSRLTLEEMESFEAPAKDQYGVILEAGARISVRRYVHASRAPIDRVDIKPPAGIARRRTRSLGTHQHPCLGTEVTQEQIEDQGYEILEQHEAPVRIERAMEVSQRWSPGLSVPVLKTMFEMEAQIEQADSMKYEISLPGGATYALCRRIAGPDFPVCVRLIV
ncbi:hypothetical protein E1N52_39190 [Paraburkholderia guartelaensis]|uniref:Uncharacterized protein n=1 Tax=Paraburkholderia guartelaensis TaxID=2546446 RepID=A0A4R5L4P0_9BURK|nr:hypothetical protein [Paraburkholderia guartelaensis]TDG02545.1 hypothetical protein E1N52_39190 [Paraburkholderia guartelaensis]